MLQNNLRNIESNKENDSLRTRFRIFLQLKQRAIELHRIFIITKMEPVERVITKIAAINLILIIIS